MVKRQLPKHSFQFLKYLLQILKRKSVSHTPFLIVVMKVKTQIHKISSSKGYSENKWSMGGSRRSLETQSKMRGCIFVWDINVIKERNALYLVMSFPSLRLSPVSSETSKCLAHGSVTSSVFLDISWAPCGQRLHLIHFCIPVSKSSVSNKLN